MTNRAAAVIIAGFLTVLIAYAVRYSYGMLLPEMLLSLEISKTQAGVIYSSYFIAYTVFSPVLGFLADRYDVRVILTVFVAVLGTGAFLMTYASSVLDASLYFTLAGIGHSACWVPIAALIQRWVPDKRRGTALALADLGSGVGVVLWSFTLPIIVVTYGWRTGWSSLGVLAFFAAGMNFLLVRPPPPVPVDPQGEDKPPPEPIKKTLFRFLKNLKFWLIGLSYLFAAFTVVVPFTFLSTYAAQELKMPYDVATGLIGIIAFAGIPGKLILSPLSDTFGRVRVIMLCGVLLTIGSFGMAYSRGNITLGMFTGVFGFGYGALWPLYAAASQDYFRKKDAGSIIGLWTVYLGIGAFLAPLMSGWLIDTTGRYASSFLMAAISALLSLLLLMPMARRSFVRI